jgi:hypothetical protein
MSKSILCNPSPQCQNQDVQKLASQIGYFYHKKAISTNCFLCSRSYKSYEEGEGAQNQFDQRGKISVKQKI